MPPRSPPALPPCPVGLQGGSGVSPVVSGRVTLDSHPHTSVLAPDAPRTWRPAPYKRRSGLTGAPATAPWPVTLLRSRSPKPRPGSQGPESSIPETLQDTPLPPECPRPRTELAALGFDGGSSKGGVDAHGGLWGSTRPSDGRPHPTPEMDITHLRVRTPSPKQRQTSPEEHNWPGLRSVSTSRMVLAAQGDFC